ncbi:hypothetical protein AVEN_20324-1 [Araneus ventricosus]|uniref:Pre-C2HC domain-containing protein n=1 Tax=Araneus ventricosus TaxID=182803 RepID=A0A4Y2XA75_ARAVE|nr:hypothetical protein AVEN_20324-1 [Araneus ventricosus]
MERKAAREIQQPEPTPLETANAYTKLAEENIQEEAPKSIPEINLKIIPNYSLIIKEIRQRFPNTENRLRREFIEIKADTKENREKIINLLRQKKLEFVLSEAYEDRPVKVVIRDLPIDMEIPEIIQNLEEKFTR